MTSENRKNIIIDTDCGIDDAIALLLALNSSDIADVLAVTCCFGNTSLDNVCRNVKRVLTLCNQKSIPIYRGCSGPLITREAPITFHGNDGLGNCGHEFPFCANINVSDIPASLALIDYSKKYYKEITLIAIGPLTNLAVAHRIAPTFTENLNSIAIMGGNYKGIGNVTELAEFNFYCDPQSADIILSEARCSVMLVPWEATVEYGIKWDTYHKLLKLGTPKSNFFKQITKFSSARGLKDGDDQVENCDFLAVVAALYPQSVKSSLKSHIRVECEGDLSKGLTVLTKESLRADTKEKVEIITDYNQEFLNWILEKILS